MCPSDNSYFDCINLCFEKNKFKMLTPILSGKLKQQNEEAMSLAVGRLNSIAGGRGGGGAEQCLKPALQLLNFQAQRFESPLLKKKKSPNPANVSVTPPPLPYPN